jgi:hypothetical protein
MPNDPGTNNESVQRSPWITTLPLQPRRHLQCEIGRLKTLLIQSMLADKVYFSLAPGLQDPQRFRECGYPEVCELSKGLPAT